MSIRLRWASQTFLTALSYLCGLLMVFPVAWMLVTGFKHEVDAAALPPGFLFTPTLEHYTQAVSSGVLDHLIHSALAGLGSTLLALLFGVPAAFALAQLEHRRNESVLFWFISTKLMPPVAVIMPVFILFKNLKLLDSIPGLILIYTAGSIPVVVWMMRSFFAEVPRGIMEAARVDGCDIWRALLQVMLPLARPGLAATALLCLIFTWNEFLFAVTLSYTEAATMPMFIASFMTSEGLFWARLSAVSTIAVLPPVVLGWMTQRQLIRGLTMGAVKG